VNSNMFQLIRRGSFEEFQNALQEVKDVNFVINESGKNMLISAVEYDKFDVAKLLIERGCDIDHQDNEGNTALHCVAKLYTSPKYAELLVNNHASLDLENEYGNEPLWDAVFNACKAANDGENSLVEYLVKQGADAKHKNRHGKSPLDFVSNIKDEVLINILLSNTQ
jgi:uncharacterized protein